mgnify:CR=1 FL=1
MDTTPNWGLSYNPLPTEFITPTRWSLVTQTLDRIANFLYTYAYGGVCTGWQLQVDGTLTPGSGLLQSIWCATTEATDITSILVSGQTNYIYIQATDQSQLDGSVTISSALSTTTPTGAVRLGTVTVDGGGTITAVDNNPSNYLRDVLTQVRKQIVEDTWTGTVEAGSYVDVLVDHSDDTAFNQGFLPYVTACTTDVRLELLGQHLTANTFGWRVHNESTDPYQTTVEIDWTRQGE